MTKSRALVYWQMLIGQNDLLPAEALVLREAAKTLGYNLAHPPTLFFISKSQKVIWRKENNNYFLFMPSTGWAPSRCNDASFTLDALISEDEARTLFPKAFPINQDRGEVRMFQKYDTNR